MYSLDSMISQQKESIGEPTNYTNWLAGEPDNRDNGNEGCVVTKINNGEMGGHPMR